MADEYDVESKISVNDKAALEAIGRIADGFDQLQAHAIKTGQIIKASLSGLRPEAKAFATTVGIAGARMNSLAMNTGKVSAATKPLATALERANAATTRLAAAGQRAGNTMTQGFQRAGAAGSSLGGVVRQVLGFAAAYVGVQALIGGFKSLVRESFMFARATEKNRVALGSVLAASQAFKGIADPAERMAKAGRVGDAVFRQLQSDALKSVATSQELATIYTGISGPLIGAGAKLSDIRQITNDAVSAASVLGVDFAQASRDIMLMSTGAAGMDTALFRMLRSTGAITQTTQEWNNMLPEKRLQAMKTALAGFGPAAAAFEKTLPGITSSFVDYMQRFRAVLMAGPLESVRKTLVRLVDVFRSNETRISALLTVMGNAFARFLDPMLNAFGNATEWFINNWETIAVRIETAWKRIQALGGLATTFAPTLGAGAKAAGGAALLGKLAPGALGGGIGAVKAGLAGGQAVAGASGLSTAITGITHLVSVIAAMGGTFTILLPIAAVLVGLFAVLTDTWSHLAPVLAIAWVYLQTIFQGLWGLVTAVFGAIMPLLKIVGVVVGSLLALGAVISFIFGRLFLAAFTGVMSILTTVFEYLGKGFTWVYEHIVGIFTSLLDLLAVTHKDLLPAGAGAQPGGFMSDLRMQFDKAMAGFQQTAVEDTSVLGQAEAGAPGERKTTINDFRGSKIEVKQDFRNANPDNIWLQMLDGINGAADQRLSSALVPEFTR